VGVASETVGPAVHADRPRTRIKETTTARIRMGKA